MKVADTDSEMEDIKDEICSDELSLFKVSNRKISG